MTDSLTQSLKTRHEIQMSKIIALVQRDTTHTSRGSVAEWLVCQI